MSAFDLKRFKRTRIAPTPSGYCHLGNAYSFLLTAALAKRHGASLLLRIDDLDRERFREEYLEDIFETLRFLGIQWNEGPRDAADFHARWSQRFRMESYGAALENLKNEGKVFGCRCTRSELAGSPSYPGTCISRHLLLDAPETAWRLHQMGEPVFFFALEGSSREVALPGEMWNLVVRKKGGDPSYHLASVVDDLTLGVDLVVRGRDLLPSTLGQVQLAGKLGINEFGSITFHHHPLIEGPGGLKLSKSAGSASIRALRKEGRTLEQVIELIKNDLGSNALSDKFFEGK